MKFTEIPDTIMNRRSVPNNMRPFLGAISSLDSKIIDYIQATPDFKPRDMIKIVRKMNSLAYQVIIGDYIDFDVSTESGYNSIMLIDDVECSSKLGNLFIDVADVMWDVEYSENAPIVSETLIQESYNDESFVDPTNKNSTDSDISLSFPKVPRFDPNKVWAIGKDIYGRLIPIHPTLPEIPTVQNEISITTNVSKFSKQDLLNLFPNKRLRPRHDELYQKIDGFEWDPVLGYIPKILDFTKEQIVENLIKYPKFNYMYREFGEDNRVNFTSFLESNENLVPLKVAVEVVPDMVALPKSKIFYMDYIVRRYLLERDVLGIEHKFPLYGTFDPFMTLFTTMEEYAALGYSDFESMAKQCVIGRVKFYQSRNPLVRGLLNESRIS